MQMDGQLRINGLHYANMFICTFVCVCVSVTSMTFVDQYALQDGSSAYSNSGWRLWRLHENKTMSLLWARQLSMQIRIDPCLSIKLIDDCVRTAAFCQSIREPVVISSSSGQPPGPGQFSSQRFWTNILPGRGAEPVSTQHSVCLCVWPSVACVL